MTDQELCKPVEAVLFDVGGVLQLMDHERIQDALDPMGVTLPIGFIDRAHYLAVAEEEGWNRPRQEAPGYEGYLRSYLLALEIPPEKLEPAFDLFMQRLGDGGAWTRVVDAAPEVLRYLTAQGIKIAVISNSLAGGVEGRLRTGGVCQVGEGVGARVGVVVDSHQAGLRKPDPAIFEMALAAIEVSPDRAVFVGDEVFADIGGAQGVGMGAIHFDPLCLCPFRDHPHANSLADIPALVGVEGFPGQDRGAATRTEGGSSSGDG